MEEEDDDESSKTTTGIGNEKVDGSIHGDDGGCTDRNGDGSSSLFRIIRA